MPNPTPLQSIIDAYNADVTQAYAAYIDTLQQAARPVPGSMAAVSREMLENGEAFNEVKRAGGKLGASIGAAGKRARREVLFQGLQHALKAGADVTPTVACRAAERVLGRGISMRTANTMFGQPGRTAKHKSGLTADDLAELENRARTDINALLPQLADIRERHRRNWVQSRRRAQLLDDWKTALKSAPGQPPSLPKI